MKVRSILYHILSKTEEEKRNYLSPGEHSPEGSPVQTGERGGHYWVPTESSKPVAQVFDLDRSWIRRQDTLRDLGLKGGVNDSAMAIGEVGRNSLEPHQGISETRVLIKYDFQGDQATDNMYTFGSERKIQAETARYRIDQALGYDTCPEVMTIGNGFAMRWVDDSGFSNQSTRQLKRNDDQPLSSGQLRAFANITIMDCLLGNSDRHRGNYIVDDENDKVWSIDNEAGDLSEGPSSPLLMLVYNLPGLTEQYDLAELQSYLENALGDAKTQLNSVRPIIQDTLYKGVDDEIVTNMLNRRTEQIEHMIGPDWTNTVATWDRLAAKETEARALANAGQVQQPYSALTSKARANRQFLDYILIKSEEELRNYLSPGEKAPPGSPVKVGERGGHYWVPDGNGGGPASPGVDPNSLDPNQFVQTVHMKDLGLEGGVNESASSVVWVEEGTLPSKVGLSDTKLLVKYNFEPDPNGSSNDYYYDYPVKVMSEIARHKIDQILGHGLVPDVLTVGEGFAMRWVDEAGFGGTGVKHAPGVKPEWIYEQDPDEITTLTPNQLQGFADMSILDCLMGNGDRHPGNWLIDNDNDKVWAIDNEAGDLVSDTIWPLKMIAGNLPDIAQYDIEAFRDSLLDSIQNVREHVVDIGNIVLETLGSLPSDVNHVSDDWAYDIVASRLDEIETTLVNEWPRLKSYWLPAKRNKAIVTRAMDVLDYILAKSEEEKRNYISPGEKAPPGVVVKGAGE